MFFFIVVLMPNIKTKGRKACTSNIMCLKYRRVWIVLNQLSDSPHYVIILQIYAQYTGVNKLTSLKNNQYRRLTSFLGTPSQSDRKLNSSPNFSALLYKGNFKMRLTFNLLDFE